MAAPAALGYGGAARIIDLVVGPIIASFAIVAIWEVCRSVGRANVILGAWLMLAPWLLSYEAQATANSLSTGIVIAIFGYLAKAPADRYGGGWSDLWKQSRLHHSR